MMRQHDWSRSSLGTPGKWPEGLKAALRLLPTSKFEMWLGGPDIGVFYNDAYRPTLGNKHPNALTVPTEVLYPEIWDDVRGRLAADLMPASSCCRSPTRAKHSPPRYVMC